MTEHTTYDELQEGKIDLGYSPWQVTAREGHLLALTCPECSLAAFTTKVLDCSRCGVTMTVDREWHISDTALANELSETATCQECGKEDIVGALNIGRESGLCVDCQGQQAGGG